MKRAMRQWQRPPRAEPSVLRCAVKTSLLIGMSVLGLGCRQTAHAEEAESFVTVARVHCQPATTATFRDVRTLRGTVVAAPDRDAVVSPQIAGRLRAVDVREGDTVTAGQVIAEVDSQAMADALTQPRAQLAQAEATEHNAALYADRTQHLFTRGIAARQEADDASSRREQATSAVSASQAGVNVAARNVSRASVRAPIAGVVLHVTRHTGELVDGTPATPVAEIADPASLEILTHAPPADLIYLHAEQHADVRFDAIPGRTFAAAVQAVAPSIDAQSGMGTVRLALTATENRPPFGLLGVADVIVGERTGRVFVPPSALRGADGTTCR